MRWKLNHLATLISLLIYLHSLVLVISSHKCFFIKKYFLCVFADVHEEIPERVNICIIYEVWPQLMHPHYSIFHSHSHSNIFNGWVKDMRNKKKYLNTTKPPKPREIIGSHKKINHCSWGKRDVQWCAKFGMEKLIK